LDSTLSKYFGIFKKLNIDRTHGPAPHKPILLLSVLQAFEIGIYKTPKIFILPELVGLFKANWTSLVKSNHECRISYPFYYLKSDKFWKLIPKMGFNEIEKMGSIMKSFSRLLAAVNYAQINDDLFHLVIVPEFNRLLQEFLLNEYFPNTRKTFNDSNKKYFDLFHEIENKIISEKPSSYKIEIEQLIQSHNEEEIFFRGGVFKKEIPKIYGYACCISGMKVTTTQNISMIDACHIVPFSESYDDTISNGISLCPNLHRAFDRGLIAVDDNYNVIIKPNWIEEQSVYEIKQFIGKPILLPKNKNEWPALENFHNHRNRFGF
jgi:putative restriction endonuclease